MPMTLSTPPETASPDRSRAQSPLPKGPRGLPFLGSSVELKADPLVFLTRISREYGDVVRFTLPGQQVYLLNHPDAIEEALKASGDLKKDDFTQRLSIAVGRGLLTSDGDF